MDECGLCKIILLLIVAAATKWIFAFLIDIYIYIYTYIKNENKKNVFKKQIREKQTYSDYLWRGVEAENSQYPNIRYIHLYLSIPSPPTKATTTGVPTYLPSLMYIQITHPFHLPTNFHFPLSPSTSPFHF